MKVILLFALQFLFFANLYAEAPNLLTYQGRLKEGGQAVSGNRMVEILLCDAETGVTCHSSGAQSVTVSNGLFRSTFTVPVTALVGTGNWYLEIKVGAATLTPRERLTSSVYSLFAATAAYASNIAAAAGSDGVHITSNVFIVGFSSASKFYGDGSELTNLPVSGGAVSRSGDTMTGQLTLAGSTLTVTGDAFSVGVSTFVIKNGNVGIGTAAPGANKMLLQDVGNLDLRIKSTGNSYATQYFQNSGREWQMGLLPSADVPANGFFIQDVTANPYRLVIDTSGNIGISTGAPQARLDVLAGGSSQTDMAQIWRNSGGTIVSSVSATGVMMADRFVGNGSGLTGVTGDNLGNHTATQALNLANNSIHNISTLTVAGNAFSVGGSTFIVSNGKVGIGTGAPDQKLTVNGNISQTGVLISSGAGNNYFAGDITAARYQIGGSTVVAILQGSGSLGVGVNAGRINTGDFNVFIGSAAGYSTAGTGATSNNFVGYMAGYNNSSGNQNNFMGREAGWTNTTGGNNTFVGNSAGYGNNTGMENSYLGDNAGYSNADGRQNVALGAGAGAAGASSFSSSTLVGFGAGSGITSGIGNTLLGYKAGDNVVSGNSNIIIGNNQDATASTISDELNIGGVLRGNLNAGTIGIGFTNTIPLAALDVKSTGTASDNIYAQIWRDSNGTPVASMTVTGRLSGDGSGLTGVISSPDNLGSHVATLALNMDQFPVINVSSLAMVGGGLRIATSVYSGASGIFISSGGAIQTTGVGYGAVAGNARGTGAVDLQSTRSAAFYIASGLRAAIGGGNDNTAGGQESIVAGGVANAASALNSAIGGGSNNNASGPYTAVAGGNYNAASGQYAAVGGGNGNKALGYASAISGGNANRVLGQYSMAPGGYGNDTAGNFSFAAGYLSSSTYNGTFTWADSQGVILENNVLDRTWFKNRGGFLVSGSTNTADPGFFVAGNGNVGIGTTTPSSLLEVRNGALKVIGPNTSFTNTVTIDGANSVQAISGFYASEANPRLAIGMDLINGYGNGQAGIAFSAASSAAGLVNAIGTDINSNLGFFTGGTANANEKMTIMTGGNVGIGVVSPGQALEVNGGIRINTATVQPVCSVTTRGTFWIVQGGAGVKDNVQVCAKDAAEAYAWRVVY